VGREKRNGLARRAIAEGLNVTQRKADVTFMRAAGGSGVDPPSASEACLLKGDGLPGVVERVRKCLSILERGHGRQFQTHGYGHWPWLTNDSNASPGKC
jgi:hypothetical protein